MSLEEIRVVLRVMATPAADCGGVNGLLDEHIGHVVRRIKELRVLERQVKELRNCCHAARPVYQCGILAGLADAARAPDTAGKEKRHLRSVHEH
jgi:hypothetical protein